MSYNSEKKSIIVLGGTAPHVELIKQLKARGYNTILIDYFENPPAKEYADIHLKESTMDKEKVLQIAKEYDVESVIAGCVDQANVTACYVLEKMGLYSPYSYATAEKITNKAYMKQIMFENGILTSKYMRINSLSQLNSVDLDYPVMVKPADSNSSNGVRCAESQAELYQYTKSALEISRTGKAIVESVVEGREINVYCCVSEKKAKVLMTGEKICITEGKDKVIKCYAGIAPARISEKVRRKAEEIANKIVNAFGLDNTLLFFQGMVKEDDINVLEFAPRAGGGSCFKTILGNTGFDVINATIDSYLGKTINNSFSKEKYILVTNTLYGRDGTFSHIEGYEELIEQGIIEHMLYYKKKGAVISNESSSKARIGSFIIKAKTEKEMYEKVKYAYEKIDVIDEQGLSMLRKDLNIYERRRKSETSFVS